jgi:hypothetical protein
VRTASLKSNSLAPLCGRAICSFGDECASLITPQYSGGQCNSAVHRLRPANGAPRILSDSIILRSGALSRSSIGRHQPEIMLGVLIIVLGRDPVARLEFSSGQCQVPVIVSSRVVRATWLWPRRTRCPPLRAASRYPSQSRLTRIHVCLPPFCMAHSVILAGERSVLRTNETRAVEYRSERLSRRTRAAGHIYDADAVLASG